MLEHLVIAKSNKLDVYSVQPEGLKLECSVDVWGRIAAVKALPTSVRYTTVSLGIPWHSYLSQDNCDDILVLTDHPDPKVIVLHYAVSDCGGPSLISPRTLALTERNARPTEFLHDIIVDPSGQLAVVCCYTGKVKVLMLESGSIANDFDVSYVFLRLRLCPFNVQHGRLPELNVLSLALIISDSGVHALAILHIDHNQKIQLIARDISVIEYELSPSPSLILSPTSLSSTSVILTDLPPSIIAVPSLDGSKGGVLVVGGKVVEFFEFSSDERQQLSKRTQPTECPPIWQFRLVLLNNALVSCIEQVFNGVSCFLKE